MPRLFDQVDSKSQSSTPTNQTHIQLQPVKGQGLRRERRHGGHVTDASAAASGDRRETAATAGRGPGQRLFRASSSWREPLTLLAIHPPRRNRAGGKISAPGILPEQ